jgi:Ca2+-binding RTX toxin-like protein
MRATLTLAIAIAAFGSSAVYGGATHTAETCFGQVATIADHQEDIVGTSGDDVIIGDDGKNHVLSGGGTDRICVKGGKDHVETPYPTTEIAGLYVDLGPGEDELNSASRGRTEVYGRSGVDYIFTEEGDDLIFGGLGNDHIYPAAGDDEIHGGDDNDYILASDGDDTILGDGGADYIDGGAGFDTINGGTSKTRPKNGEKARNHEDRCLVGADGGTATNCERKD